MKVKAIAALLDVYRRPWRVGGSIGRSIYVQNPGGYPRNSPEMVIGMVDTPELASLIVKAVNMLDLDLQLDLEVNGGVEMEY